MQGVPLYVEDHAALQGIASIVAAAVRSPEERKDPVRWEPAGASTNADRRAASATREKTYTDART